MPAQSATSWDNRVLVVILASKEWTCFDAAKNLLLCPPLWYKEANQLALAVQDADPGNQHRWWEWHPKEAPSAQRQCSPDPPQTDDELRQRSHAASNELHSNVFNYKEKQNDVFSAKRFYNQSERKHHNGPTMNDQLSSAYYQLNDSVLREWEHGTAARVCGTAYIAKTTLKICYWPVHPLLRSSNESRKDKETDTNASTATDLTTTSKLLRPSNEGKEKVF